MAISQDASTPSPAYATAASPAQSVTASFSPPSGSLVAVLVAVCAQSTSGSPVLSVTDSGSHTWTQRVAIADTTYSAAGIFTAYFASAPGSITVTGHSTIAVAGVMTAPVVLDGAAVSQSGAATASTASSASTHAVNGSITTTTAGSWVLTAGAAGASGGTHTPTAATSNLAAPYIDSSDAATFLAGKQTAATGTPGAVSLGWTASTGSDAAWCALEILPATGFTTPVSGVASGTGSASGSMSPAGVLAGYASGSGTTAATRHAAGSFAGHASGSGLGGTPVVTSLAGYASGSGTTAATRHAAGSFAGHASGSGLVTLAGAIVVVNQWAAAFSQPASLQNMPPALQSTVIALDTATSVGDGSGTPAAGNWLFLIAGWNQAGLPPATVGNADDIHSFWRPGDVTSSTWAVSAAAGNTRTSVWYTPNLARVPGNTYTAPNGVMAGMACLVIEVSGLGPWDVVTGISTAYAARSASLTLALPAPAASAFTIAAVCGDNTAASQSLAPSGWTTLHTVAATNGTDHSCDAVLTSAVIPASGALSVTATSSASDLSGVIIGVEAAAASPIPATQNPDWPLVIFEAAFGGGFQTPPDQLTWYDLSDRLWSWDETTGVQYQLGDLQATNLDLELDNFDNALASDNTGSPYYSNALNENMSFAAAITPWTATGSSALAWSSAQAYSSSPGAVASMSLQVTPDGSTAHPGAISEMIPVSASTPCSASAWFYSVAGYGTGAQVAITWYTAAGGAISTVTSGAVAVPAATWTPAVALNRTSPSNAAYAAVTVQFSGTPPATAYWVAEGALAPGASAVATGLITTGVPVRIRAACGTIGGVVDNRWRIIQRNAENWEQQVDAAFRRFCAVTATDIWSTMSNIGVTPYRGEVIQDHPYAWWPLDDQLVEGGVLPVTMANAASGNTNVLSIALSPSGAMDSATYSTQGLYNTYRAGSAALYTVAALQGWMPGDPQSSAQAAQSTQSGNATTAQPGSAAWQQAGMIGGTGSQGWYLACQDTSYPSVTGGVTIEGWWNYGWFGGTASGGFIPGDPPTGTSSVQDIANQPYCPLTLFAITSGSAMVAELQLDLTGHLHLNVTESGTPTAYSIYTATDLRSGSWHHYALALTTTGYTVYVDGGQTARVSGTLSGVAASFSWLVVNGDMGANAASDTSAYEHGGNVAISHVKIYPAVLPAYRIWSHYVAAVTAFGLIPAPTAVTPEFPTTQWTADGIPLFSGADTPYGYYGGAFSGGSAPPPNPVALAAIVTANLGAYTSGPSAWTVLTGYISAEPAWVSWAGLAPLFTVYTGSTLGGELESATVNGAGDTFYGGYGASADGVGPAQVAGGTGASPPTSASAIGDTVQQRLERVMAYGLVTYPGRCIDPAPLLVQGATDVGGQGTADNFENLTGSDGGLTFVDNCGNLTYWQRPHLAGQYASPVWAIGPASSPYYREIKWIADQQRIWNSITLTPFSPDDALLPLIIPAQAAQVLASQTQFGAQSKQVTNYLQSQPEMQLQANSLFQNFGTLHIRAENVKLDAAPDSSLWPMILGVNISDIVTGQMWQIGAGGITWTFRVSEIKRHIEFNGDTGKTEASAVLKLDFEPTYWT